MSVYDFFKNIFGLRNRNNTPQDTPSFDPSRGNEFKKPVWIDEYEEEDDDDILSLYHGTHTFPVLSDPIEIHRYFEQQMEHMQEMMKSFSMFSPTSIFDFSGGNETKAFGAIEQPKDYSRSLRDHYLKRPDDPAKAERRDIDLDSRVTTEGLGKILEDVEPSYQVTPAVPSTKFQFFGESVISQTIRKPDGTVETRTTTKRSDGTEDTVVSIQKPDGTEDVHSESSLLPTSEIDVFRRRGVQEDFLIDILKSFFRN